MGDFLGDYRKDIPHICWVSLGLVTRKCTPRKSGKSPGTLLEPFAGCKAGQMEISWDSPTKHGDLMG